MAAGRLSLLISVVLSGVGGRFVTDRNRTDWLMLELPRLKELGPPLLEPRPHGYSTSLKPSREPGPRVLVAHQLRGFCSPSLPDWTLAEFALLAGLIGKARGD